MKQYRVVSSLTLPAGTVVQLTQEQAMLRQFQLEHIGQSIFLVKTPVGFKVGEELGLIEDVPKAVLAQVEASVPEDDPEAEARAAAERKAAAEAEAARLAAEADVKAKGKGA